MRKIQSVAVANLEKICPVSSALREVALESSAEYRQSVTLSFSQQPFLPPERSESGPLVDLAKRAFIRQLDFRKRNFTRRHARIRNTRNPIGHCLVW